VPSPVAICWIASASAVLTLCPPSLGPAVRGVIAEIFEMMMIAPAVCQTVAPIPEAPICDG